MTPAVTRSLVERADVRIELLSQGKGPLVVMIPSLGRPAVVVKVCDAKALARLLRESQIQREEIVLIGVGGVFSGADLKRKLDLGASLVQLYTGWVYGGPKSAAQILLDYLQANP